MTSLIRLIPDPESLIRVRSPIPIPSHQGRERRRWRRCWRPPAPSASALLDEPLSGCVCGSCWRSVLPITPPICDRCGDPLARQPIPNPDPNPRDPCVRDVHAVAAQSVARGGRRVRGYPARDHSRVEVRRPYFAGAAIGRADAPAWERSPEGRGLRRARPASLATRIPARIQSGTRNRTASGPARRESASSASRNTRASRAPCRSASRECGQRVRFAPRMASRADHSRQKALADRRRQYDWSDFGGVRWRAERLWCVRSLRAHRRPGRHPAARQF